MSNICNNTINAEGTPSQIDEFIQRLTDTYDKYLHVDDKFSIEDKTSATLTIKSLWKIPKETLIKITSLLPDTEGLYIRITSEEPGEEYFEKAVFQNGRWSFDSIPDINAQIHALTQQGIGLIKKRIEETGNIDFGEDCTYVALYINDDGYAECPYFRRIELESNNKLTVLLSDDVWLYEDDLTAVHIMDILTLIEEGHVTYIR